MLASAAAKPETDPAALGRAALAQFLRSWKAYDLMPESGKVVVFDTDVPIRLAFYALVEHDAACAPLWDTARGRFSGMLTTTDLCDIMRIFHVPGTQSTAAALSEFTIATWRSYANSMAGQALPSSGSFAQAAAAPPGSADKSSGTAGAGAAAGGDSPTGGAASSRRPRTASSASAAAAGAAPEASRAGAGSGMRVDGEDAADSGSLRGRAGTADPSGVSRSLPDAASGGSASIARSLAGDPAGVSLSDSASSGRLMAVDDDSLRPGRRWADSAVGSPHLSAGPASAGSATESAAGERRSRSLSGGAEPSTMPLLGGQTPHGQERRSRASTDAADGAGGGAGGAGSQRRPAAGIHRDLIAIDPEDDLMTVSLKLLHHGIHHLPVFDADQNAVLAILSYRALLLHLTAKFTDAEAVRMMEQPLRALGVGSFGEDILVVPETASVVSVLHVLAERRISSVPIVAADGSNVLVDVYSREDVAFLANDPTLMVLDAPVGDVRRAQISMTGIGSNLLVCAAEDTLAHAITLFAAAGGRAERIVCVDVERRVTGIVSLSDLFAYICKDEAWPVPFLPGVGGGAGLGGS